MGFALPSSKAFDPAAFAKGLMHSRMHQHSAWRGQLDTLTEDHSYYVQKEFLQRYDPTAFELWFGLSTMLQHLSRDPLLATQHNPGLWLFALRNAMPNPLQACQTLHAYWSGVPLMRPREHIEPKLLAQIHTAVAQTVARLQEDNHPWTAGLNPGVLSCEEETALFSAPNDKAVQALSAYTLQYRDLDGLRSVLLPFPVLTVVLAIIEGKCFPQRYECNPMPWPCMDTGWTDDMRLAWHAIAMHPQLRSWWTHPVDAPALADHLKEPALMIDMGLQLHYLDTLKHWMNEHA